MKCATPSSLSWTSRSVRVRDIARVSWDTQPWSYFARFNGKRAVIVTANQKDGFNILTLSERLTAAVDRFEKAACPSASSSSAASSSRAT